MWTTSNENKKKHKPINIDDLRKLAKQADDFKNQRIGYLAKPDIDGYTVYEIPGQILDEVFACFIIAYKKITNIIKMNADIAGALEQLDKSYKAFEHRGKQMTKEQVRKVLNYGLKKGYISTGEFLDEEVDMVIGLIDEQKISKPRN